MSDYDLSRLSVLIVEDNSYLRSLMTMAMNALGVGVIKTAEDGGEAIEILKLMKLNPGRAGIMHVDIIISNWQMSPIDGAMLLRWVRRHKESPNRFVPFIMITGYADIEKVNEVRDLGVTEMIAKPFSVKSISDKLLQVIDRPRQFVHTADYFGPDRRRKNMPHGKERRELTDDSEEVEIVHE